MPHALITDTTTAAPVFATGLASLDAAAGPSEAVGLARPGELWLLAGGTGHGKTTLVNQLFGAMLADLAQGWGLRDAVGVLAYTENDHDSVLRGAGLTAGRHHHAVARNARIAKVASRAQLATVVYDTVIDAVDRAGQTGRPIAEFLVRFVVVDFFDHVDTDRDALATLLRDGIAAWDPDVMAAASGVRFDDYAGFAWPDGCDGHRVAVLAAAQTHKHDPTVTSWSYQPGRSRREDFVALDALGVPLWELRDGDAPLPAPLRAPADMVASATGVIRFHRSRPNAAVLRDNTGQIVGLDDTRARLLVTSTTRTVHPAVIPLRFDVNPEKTSGRFYDTADEDHRAGVAAWDHTGVPRLPQRNPTAA